MITIDCFYLITFCSYQPLIIVMFRSYLRNNTLKYIYLVKAMLHCMIRIDRFALVIFFFLRLKIQSYQYCNIILKIITLQEYVYMGIYIYLFGCNMKWSMIIALYWLFIVLSMSFIY